MKEIDVATFLSLEKTAKPDRLSTEEVGNLISAFGNNEAKAATLIAMEVGFLYSSYDLQQTMKALQGNDIGWNMSTNNAFGYCKNSLSPIGLVALETLNENGTEYGYTKTGYGERIGNSFAGLLLAFSERHSEISLCELFGGTSSNAKPVQAESSIGTVDYKFRTPTLRLQIFWELATSDQPITWKDLHDRLNIGVYGQLSNHINELARDYIISFQSRGSDKSYKMYSLFQDHPVEPPSPTPSTRGRMKSLTKEVYEIVQTLGGWFTTGQVIETYFEKFPEKREKRSLPKEIYRVLRHIEKSDYLAVGRFSKEFASEISLSESQRSTLVELLTIIDGFQNQDPDLIELGKREAMNIKRDAERFSKLMAKAKEHSPRSNSISMQETKQLLYGIVRENPNITANQATRILEQRHNKKLKIRTVVTYLDQLKDERMIKLNKRKRSNYWVAIDPTQN